MIKRGRILRDTNSGAGLISAEGKQYEFTLENSWDCDLPPKVGMVVDLELDNDGKLTAAWAVDQKELAKEQANLILNVIKEKSLVYYNSMSELLGKPVLMATVALFVGWFIFSTINISFGGKDGLSFTFWQILGLVNNASNVSAAMMGGDSGKGLYGILCIAALAGPFVFIFWKNPLAHLGNCLPLLLILLVVGSSYMSYADQMNAGREAMGALGDAKAQKMMEDIADQAWKQAMQMFSIGLGAHISLAASVFLAFIGVKKFLIASAESNLSPKASVTRSSVPTGRRSSKISQPSSTDAPANSAVNSSVKAVISRTCHACAATCDEAAAFCEACGTKLS